MATPDHTADAAPNSTTTSDANGVLGVRELEVKEARNDLKAILDSMVRLLQEHLLLLDKHFKSGLGLFEFTALV